MEDPSHNSLLASLLVSDTVLRWGYVFRCAPRVYVFQPQALQ